MKRSTIWGGTNLLLVASMFLARPGVLGEYFGFIYLAVAIFLICVGLAKGRLDNFSSRDSAIVFLAYGIYWGYRVGQAIVQGHQEVLLSLSKSTVFEVTTVALIFTHLAGDQRRHQFYLFFASALALLGYSSMASEVLSWLGHSAAISLYTFTRTTSDLSTDIIFQLPFSFSYGEYHGVSSHILYRYTGGFVEAGIYPAFGCWAIAYTALTPGRKLWIILGCLLGVVATFATAAVLCISVLVPLLLFALIVRSSQFALSMKIPALITIILVIPLSIAAVYLAPDIGLADKAETHSTSINDRSENIRRAVSSLPSNPFGHFIREENQAICLLAAGYALGSIGLILWLLKFASSVCSRGNDPLRLLVCISPLLLTIAVAQPLFDAMPAVIMLFFTRFPREESY